MAGNVPQAKHDTKLVAQQKMAARRAVLVLDADALETKIAATAALACRGEIGLCLITRIRIEIRADDLIGWSGGGDAAVGEEQTRGTEVGDRRHVVADEQNRASL